MEQHIIGVMWPECTNIDVKEYKPGLYHVHFEMVGRYGLRCTFTFAVRTDEPIPSSRAVLSVMKQMVMALRQERKDLINYKELIVAEGAAHVAICCAQRAAERLDSALALEGGLGSRQGTTAIKKARDLLVPLNNMELIEEKSKEDLNLIIKGFGSLIEKASRYLGMKASMA